MVIAKGIHLYLIKPLKIIAICTIQPGKNYGWEDICLLYTVLGSNIAPCVTRLADTSGALAVATFLHASHGPAKS